MSFVLDASISAAWAFDEAHPDAKAALNRIVDEGAIVPSIWWFELRNVLVVNERRGRGSPEATARFLEALRSLSIEIEPLGSDNSGLGLARKHRLTYYDAAYLESAMRRGLAIATLDSALATAARAEGVPLVTNR